MPIVQSFKKNFGKNRELFLYQERTLISLINGVLFVQESISCDNRRRLRKNSEYSVAVRTGCEKSRKRIWSAFMTGGEKNKTKSKFHIS